ncbi:hypothetical protein ACLKA6_001932 [Drosophila palustris]
MTNVDEIKIDLPPLSFEKCPESDDERNKRLAIEQLIAEGPENHIPIEELRKLALSDFGLVNDDLRRTLWPQLAGVDVTNLERVPTLSELQSHPEYNQVVLDVNRSLKRFPPGIPYEQRIALQDQLTVLILRVINKYPNLRYYQGYHDVAVTFLLVAGEEVAYAIMEELSTTHFSECMQETMEATQRRLMFIWPVVLFEQPELFQFLQRSSVGTLFALPWSQSILNEDCDMASVHCLLSKLPDDLPFEDLLKKSSKLYEKYSLTVIEKKVEELIKLEKEQRQLEERNRLRARSASSKPNYKLSICAYYYKNQYLAAGIS